MYIKCDNIIIEKEGLALSPAKVKKMEEKKVFITRLLIAVLVLIIIMLSIALWSSSYINRLDTYYFNEYLSEADQLEDV